MRLPAHYAGIVTPLILSIFMTFIVSGVATAQNLGLAPHALGAWMNAWGASWAVAFPTLLLVLPVVRRIVGALVQPAGR